MVPHKYLSKVAVLEEGNAHHHQCYWQKDVPCERQQRRSPTHNARVVAGVKQGGYQVIATVGTPSNHKYCHDLQKDDDQQPPDASNSKVQEVNDVNSILE